MQLEGKRIGFVFTGSFCTFRKTIEEFRGACPSWYARRRADTSCAAPRARDRPRGRSARRSRSGQAAPRRRPPCRPTCGRNFHAAPSRAPCRRRHSWSRRPCALLSRPSDRQSSWSRRIRGQSPQYLQTLWASFSKYSSFSPP